MIKQIIIGICASLPVLGIHLPPMIKNTTWTYHYYNVYVTSDHFSGNSSYCNLYRTITMLDTFIRYGTLYIPLNVVDSGLNTTSSGAEGSPTQTIDTPIDTSYRDVAKFVLSSESTITSNFFPLGTFDAVKLKSCSTIYEFGDSICLYKNDTSMALCCPSTVIKKRWYLDSCGTYWYYDYLWGPGITRSTEITLLSFNNQKTIIPIEIAVPTAHMAAPILLISHNPMTTFSSIQLVSTQAGIIKLNLYNIKGELVFRNIAYQIRPGNNYLRIPSTNLPNGVYFIKASISTKAIINKIIIAK